MPSSNVTHALFVPLLAKSERVSDVQSFLGKGYELVQSEPDTIQWFGARYDDEDTFMIFDTFRGKAGRTAHLTGKIAAALMENAGALLAAGPEIKEAVVLADNITGSLEAGRLGVGLRVLLTAKPEKVQSLRQFLVVRPPLSRARSPSSKRNSRRSRGMRLSFPAAINSQSSTFFADEAGRTAHLNGKVAAALFANAETLLATAPDVKKVSLIAADVKA
ncbi:Antibiotic biosynthesis monooxygenase [Mycena sanguinolenta]|uniref:Antibiotic biosynthesis monooxygenase n=1 Tax=Mycena sanguinolenta TaxID=230812 RepID=A0A8H6ZC70_9AGAR|nr:Antibiotic biosynthesis monooxygenase [Mycena sanguinolenta]